MDNDEHLRKAFSFFDLNGDGFIDRSELQEMLQGELGEDGVDIVNDIIQEVDVDKVGAVYLHSTFVKGCK